MTKHEQRVECARCGAMYLCLPGRQGGPIRWLREHFATDHGGVPLPRLPQANEPGEPLVASARGIDVPRCACGLGFVALGYLSQHREGCPGVKAAAR